MANKVKRTIVVPADVDEQLTLIAEQAGMTVDDLYAYVGAMMLDFPTSVLKTHMTDLYRRMHMKA